MTNLRKVTNANQVDFTKLRDASGQTVVPVVCVRKAIILDDIVLMVGFANADAVQRTLEIGRATFWSRSRCELWTKGDTSGNFLSIRGVYSDCDNDSLMYVIDSDGPACHTLAKTCFQLSERIK